MIRQILLGKKTETRRLAKGAPYYIQPRTKTGQRKLRSTQSSVLKRPFEPMVGKSYAVQPGRGEKELFRIACTGRRLTRLGTMDHESAIREGFPAGVTAFARYWLTLHDKTWPRLEKVFCPTCLIDADYPADELPPCPTCGGDGEIKIRPTPTDDEALARFDKRWGDEMVWEIGFKVQDREQVRLLMEHRGGDLRGDYTTSTQQGMSGGVHQDAAGAERAFPEPEALSEDDWKDYVRRYSVLTTSQWVELEKSTRDEQRHRSAITERVKAVERESRQSIDVRSDLRQVKQLIAQGAAPEKIETHLRRVEGRIDRQHERTRARLGEAA